MLTQESLAQFMNAFGFRPSTTKPEIKELPNLLAPDEQLHGLLEGLLKKVHNRDINGYGLVIATNRRIIFFRKSIFGTVTKEEIQLRQVSSSSFRKGLTHASVTIIAASNQATVEHCDKTVAVRFNDAVQKLLNAPVATATTVTQPTNNLEQLEKLFDLKQKGILTEEEYASQKAKLLV